MLWYLWVWCRHDPHSQRWGECLCKRFPVILSLIFIYSFGMLMLWQSFCVHSHPFFHYIHLSLAISLDQCSQIQFCTPVLLKGTWRSTSFPKSRCLALSEMRHIQSISKYFKLGIWNDQSCLENMSSELCMSPRGKVRSCRSQLMLLGGCRLCKDKAYAEAELECFWVRCLAGRDARCSFLARRLNGEALKFWLW